MEQLLINKFEDYLKNRCDSLRRYKDRKGKTEYYYKEADRLNNLYELLCQVQEYKSTFNQLSTELTKVKKELTALQLLARGRGLDPKLARYVKKSDFYL